MGLSAQDEKDFSECFEMFDEEGEGVVEVKQLSKMMTLLGWNPTIKELEDVVKKAKLRGKVFFLRFQATLESLLKNDFFKPFFVKFSPVI